MKKGLRSLFVVGAAAAAIVVGTVPASAQTVAVGAIIGGGGISPGLNDVVPSGHAQTFGFGTTIGAAAGVGNGSPAAGTLSCTVNGDDTIGTVEAGAGNFSGTCSGAANDAVVGTYIRAGAIVEINGTATGSASGTFAGVCVFVAGSAPPIKTYTVVCVFAIAGA